MTRLISCSVADDASLWATLGFVVNDHRVQVGPVAFVLTGASSDKGITSWMLSADSGALPGSIDGLITDSIVGARPPDPAPSHPNGVTGIDHLVVSTPHLARTVDVFEDLGIECRRQRDGAAYGQQQMKQAFFWLGSGSPSDRVILEIVGPSIIDPDPAVSDAPASFFGIAFVADDLTATQSFFGDLMKPPIDAVQAGRLITTISSRAGSSLAMAVMSPHA